jgi:hypothetical protein
MSNVTAERESKNIHNAICHYTLFNCPEINDEFFRMLLEKIDLSNITDREFLSNERIRRFVNYERISKKQLVRLITREPEILNKVNINKFRFKIKDLEYFLKLWPEYIDLFNFDTKNVSGDEFLILLRVDVKYISELNLESIDFTKYQLTELIKGFQHRGAVMQRFLDSEKVSAMLDNYQIRQIINLTGERYVDRLDLSRLNDLDWFEILQKNPKMLPHCDTGIFEKNDCYMLVRLIKFIPELEDLVVANKEKITNLGWEKLLWYDFEKFYPLCCFDCLDYKTRKLFMHKLGPR